MQVFGSGAQYSRFQLGTSLNIQRASFNIGSGRSGAPFSTESVSEYFVLLTAHNKANHNRQQAGWTR